jgi:lipopolysaccharide transport system permease protein
MFINKLEYYKDLIVILTQKEMKIRYKSSFLGYIWSIGQPLAFAFVYFVAFKVVMKVKMENYTLFLISGLFPWQCFNNSVAVAPMVFLGNGSIIKKVNFPRNIILIANILQDLIHFLLSFPIIILFLIIYNQHPYWSWLYGLPLLLSVQFLMTYGLAIIVASINLFFRDMERLVIIFMTFLFYFTPVLYSIDMIPKEYVHLINFNPVAPLMISWRELILNGSFEMNSLFISFCYASILFVVGQFVYRKLSVRFAEVL